MPLPVVGRMQFRISSVLQNFDTLNAPEIKKIIIIFSLRSRLMKSILCSSNIMVNSIHFTIFKVPLTPKFFLSHEKKSFFF